MPSLKPLPDTMIGAIDALLEMHRSKCIAIYPEAEKIRLRWEDHNIALEDVVCVLVERCSLHNVALSFDRSTEVDVLMEGTSKHGSDGA